MSNKPTKRYIVDALIFLFSLNFISLVVSMIISIYLARVLEVSELGHYRFFLSMIEIATVLSTMGLSVFLGKQLPEEQRKGNDPAPIISVVFLIYIVLFLTTIAIYAVFVNTNEKVFGEIKSHFGLFTIGVFFSSAYVLCTALFQGFGYIKTGGSLMYINRIIPGLMVIFAAFWISSNYATLVFSNYLGVFIILVFAVYYLLKKAHQFLYFVRPKWKLTKKMIGFIYYIAFMNLMIVINSNTDIFFLKYFWGAHEVGLYHVAFRIPKLIAGLVFGNIYSVFIYYFTAGHSEAKDYKGYVSRGTRLTFFVGGLIASALISSREIIPLLYGDKYIESMIPFSILSLTIMLSGGSAFSAPYYYSKNDVKTPFKIIFLFTFFNIIFDLLLIPRFNIHGAAFGTITGNIISLFCLFYFLRTREQIEITFLWSMKYFLLILVMIFISLSKFYFLTFFVFIFSVLAFGMISINDITQTLKAFIGYKRAKS